MAKKVLLIHLASLQVFGYVAVLQKLLGLSVARCKRGSESAAVSQANTQVQ